MDWRWDTLHNDFSGFVVLLSAFHLAINWDWVLAAVLKFFNRDVSSRGVSSSIEEGAP
jgi:hypothetical protein